MVYLIIKVENLSQQLNICSAFSPQFSCFPRQLCAAYFPFISGLGEPVGFNRFSSLLLGIQKAKLLIYFRRSFIEKTSDYQIRRAELLGAPLHCCASPFHSRKALTSKGPRLYEKVWGTFGAVRRW